MRGLKWTWPSPQPRCAGPGVGPGMQAAEEKIKGQGPKGYTGEVGKRTTGVLPTAVRAIPAEDDEYGGEGPERERKAQQSENGGRE